MFLFPFFHWPHWFLTPVACAEAFSVPKDLSSAGNCATTARWWNWLPTCTVR